MRRSVRRRIGAAVLTSGTGDYLGADRVARSGIEELERRPGPACLELAYCPTSADPSAMYLGEPDSAVALLRKATDLLDGAAAAGPPALLACREQLAELVARESRSLSRRRSRSGWRAESRRR